MSNENKNNSVVGHRQRLRQKFLQSGFIGFHDYEIVELLLTLGTPRRDCKQIAKNVVSRFGSFNAVLDASVEELMEIKGIGHSNIFGLKLTQGVSEVYQKRKLEDFCKLDSAESIYSYLKEKIGKKTKEYFVILFFDTKNKLILDEVSVGTLNAGLVHPREVFNKAIRHSASHVVVAHNHPSGDCTPSQEDIETTKRLIQAGNILGITLVDHIIISRNGYTSLRSKLKNYFK